MNAEDLGLVAYAAWHGTTVEHAREEWPEPGKDRIADKWRAVAKAMLAAAPTKPAPAAGQELAFPGTDDTRTVAEVSAYIRAENAAAGQANGKDALGFCANCSTRVECSALSRCHREPGPRAVAAGQAPSVAGAVALADTMPMGFADYIARNYSGEVVFSDPMWHAVRIWRTAMYFARSAPQPEARAPMSGGCHGLDTPERVRFYEHDFYVLSNFSAFSVRWEGMHFPTSEHAYQWAKFGTQPDGEAVGEWAKREPFANSIHYAESAHAAFKAAETWRAYRRPDWDAVKVDIMRDILRAKVQQHEYVQRKLLATGDRELVEDSWRDDFWGWGQNQDGQNMLGKLWMEVRAELRNRAEAWGVQLGEGEKA